MKGLLFWIVLVASAGFIPGCITSRSDTSREVNVLASLTSPNQSYVASLFNSSGGGAAGWCYLSINVRKQHDQFNPDTGLVFSTRCNAKPDLNSETEKKLSISYPADATVYIQEKAWGSGEGVEIYYQPR